MPAAHREAIVDRTRWPARLQQEAVALRIAVLEHPHAGGASSQARESLEDRIGAAGTDIPSA
eukprot:scaffold49_cov409-Prasinococcus_capsulatus_cf.AAC.42